MKGITGRWVRNTLGVTLIIIIAAVITGVFVIRSSYYNGAKNALTTEADTLCTYISTVNNYYGDFSSIARMVAEDFEEKDMARLEVFDASGSVLATSQGFSAEFSPSEDFDAALKSKDGVGIWYGRIQGADEKIMSVTSLVYDENGMVIGGVRLMSSLSRVDLAVFFAAAAFCLLGVIIMVIATMSGSYFIKSIVIPVNEITKTAKQIAAGDYSIRIEKKYDDEIGDLCDTINDLAGGLTEADRVKNDFISTVSHELRTPLTAIRGWGETLQVAGDDKELNKKGLKVIVSETSRLGKMVEELLDFSRLQSGRLTMRKSSCDIIAELQEAVLAYEQRAKNEEKTIFLSIPDEALPIIIADSDRIRQVFINIIDNAVKYTDAGGEISISVEQGNGFVTVTVADNGCGIASSDIGRVGEKFYKANFTRHGSGIGLATCDEIIRLHNGLLRIESKENEGTRVSVALPLGNTENA